MYENKQALFDTYRRLKRLDLTSGIAGLSSGDFALLRVVDALGSDNDGQGAEVSQAARQLGVSAPAVSKGIRKLEELGYLERNINKNDRRFTFITLTPKGSTALAEANAKLYEILDRIISRVGKENIDTLDRLLNEFIDAANEIKN